MVCWHVGLKFRSGPLAAWFASRYRGAMTPNCPRCSIVRAEYQQAARPAPELPATSAGAAQSTPVARTFLFRVPPNRDSTTGGGYCAPRVDLAINNQEFVKSIRTRHKAFLPSAVSDLIGFAMEAELYYRTMFRANLRNRPHWYPDERINAAMPGIP